MSSSVPGTLAGVTRTSRYHVPCIICKRRWQGDDGGSFDRCCDGCRDILIARDEASLAARSGHPVRLRPVGWPDPPPGMPAASALVSFRPLPGRGTVVAGDRGDEAFDALGALGAQLAITAAKETGPAE